MSIFEIRIHVETFFSKTEKVMENSLSGHRQSGATGFGLSGGRSRLSAH
jgi:hypothetical protein